MNEKEKRTKDTELVWYCVEIDEIWISPRGNAFMFCDEGGKFVIKWKFQPQFKPLRFYLIGKL